MDQKCPRRLPRPPAYKNLPGTPPNVKTNPGTRVGEASMKCRLVRPVCHIQVRRRIVRSTSSRWECQRGRDCKTLHRGQGQGTPAAWERPCQSKLIGDMLLTRPQRQATMVFSWTILLCGGYQICIQAVSATISIRTELSATTRDTEVTGGVSQLRIPNQAPQNLA
jgi:hypothetical protein